jgi:hypothetical protein
VTLNPTAIAQNKPGRERRMTTTSFDLEQAPKANGLFLGDYESVVAMGTHFNSFGAFFAQAENSSDPTDIFFRDPSTDEGAAIMSVAIAGESRPASVPLVIPQRVLSQNLQWSIALVNDAHVPMADKAGRHETRAIPLAELHDNKIVDQLFAALSWLMSPGVAL